MPEVTLTCPVHHLDDDTAQRLAGLADRAELLARELLHHGVALAGMYDRALALAHDLADLR